MEFPQFFTWKPDECRWEERKKGNVIGRIIDIHASFGETFFLLMLLMKNRGVESFDDLRTVNGVRHVTFKEACHALGLLQDDRQWHFALAKISHSSMRVKSENCLFIFLIIMQWLILQDYGSKIRSRCLIIFYTTDVERLTIQVSSLARWTSITIL